MIDLHTHTNESDGTFSPAELLIAAAECGLEALAITDHDTFAGYDQAVHMSEGAGVELVCGIELSALLHEHGRRQTVHLLGYFFHGSPGDEFRSWLRELHTRRKERNVQLAARLQELGIRIAVEEVEAAGRSIAGRPHFARLMVERGYARSIREAFDRYIGEEGAAFVEREGPEITECIERVLAAGGVPSLAHPIRLYMPPDKQERYIREWASRGLRALEALHSDHTPELARDYAEMARSLGLKISGGSDFHGAIKPNVVLGCTNVPRSVLDELREG